MALAASTVALIAVGVAVVGTGTSVAMQADTARKQEHALETQQLQEAAAAEIAAENTRRQGKQLQAQQQAALAQGGVLLGEEGSTGLQLSKDIETDLQRNLDIGAMQSQWKISNLEQQKGMLPSTGNLLISGGLNLASSALSTYSSMKQAQATERLLSKSSAPALQGPTELPSSKPISLL